jgi:hypothetical protein
MKTSLPKDVFTKATVTVKTPTEKFEATVLLEANENAAQVRDAVAAGIKTKFKVAPAFSDKSDAQKKATEKAAARREAAKAAKGKEGGKAAA